MSSSTRRSTRLGRWAGAAAGQWHGVVAPGIVLWCLAAALTGVALHAPDVVEYQRYAHAALALPFLHRLPAEYPAPALVVFMAPLLLPVAYPWAFAAVVGVVLLVLLVSYGTSGVQGMDVAAARRLLVYLATGALVVLTARFDLFAAAAAFWSVRAARQGRYSAAWTWSAIGFVLKLFPAVLWPVLIIGEWRRSGRIPVRRVAWVLGAFVVVAAVPALFDPGAVTTVAAYYLHRPTEIGGLAAGASVLGDWHGFHFGYSFHSVNVTAPLGSAVSVLLQVAGAAGCLAVWWAYARRRLPMEAACLLTLTLVVLCSKVLSTQYLIWLMPFWALYRIRWSWVAACVVNVASYVPSIAIMDFSLMSTHGYVATMALMNLARDLLIVVGTASWLYRLVRPSVHPAERVAPVPELATRSTTAVSSAERMVANVAGSFPPTEP